MPQFFIDRKFGAGDEVEIRGSDARHISQALRLKEGEWILLSDGEGRSFRATIRSISPGSVRAAIGDEIERHDQNHPPALALAIVKGDRFEWAIEKAVEVGCRRIIPFRSARTVPQCAEAASERKTERWRKIALSAAKQSGLPFRPLVDPTVDFAGIVGVTGAFGRSILFYEGEENNSIRSLWAGERAQREELLIIGPEGGFTDDEVILAKGAGIVTASLGSQILRVETAAIVAIAIWQYELGNMATRA